MKTIFFTYGLPASGKSTWAKYAVNKFTNTIRVNKDSIKEPKIVKI